jgi:acetyltransferase-like isoleucine patch superfamily enzyme
MALASFYQRITRRLLLARNPAKEIRKLGLRLRGAKIGKGTEIPSGTQFTWPHQVVLGSACILQNDIFFNFDHYWVPGPTLRIGDRVFIGRGCEFNIRYGLTVGNDALIASGCVFIDHDHGRDAMTNKINSDCPGSPISVGEGAWIGAGAIVLKNVAIGKHAIIGAGSVVTRSVPDFQIWAGVPAKKVISK